MMDSHARPIFLRSTFCQGVAIRMAMGVAPLDIYTVRAFNTAVAAENKIHDDTVARQFGFGGGLVPGVEVYAYMMHQAVERFGRAWLEYGSAECRLVRPVYDGQTVQISAIERNDATLEISVGSKEGVCASGTASLPTMANQAPPIQLIKQTPPANEQRPPADELSLAKGTRLTITPFRLTPDYADKYLGDVRETEPLYKRENLCHPGIILRLGNWALVQNFVLGPWIHTGSKVQNFSAAHVGDELSAQAIITQNYERKGHHLVDLDVIAVRNGNEIVARILHTAIYRPRQPALSS